MVGGCGPSVAACLGNDEPNVTAVLSPRTRRKIPYRRQTVGTKNYPRLDIHRIRHRIGKARNLAVESTVNKAKLRRREKREEPLACNRLRSQQRSDPYRRYCTYLYSG